jgi:hypothetical protein
MDSTDWKDLASVFMAGAVSFANHGVPAPTGCRENAEAYQAMAQTCDAIARERRAQERQRRSEH